MQLKMRPGMELRRRLIVGLLISGLLLFGTYVRCADAGQKVYTVDEVRGLLRASGVTSKGFVASVYTGEPVVNRDLQKYQTASVDKPLGDALSAFANNPEHPPLYYLMMRFSLQLFQQAAASRWLAIGFSLLLLPAIYWLCAELFAPAAIRPAVVGHSVLALVAVSPFQVLLAQEARQYTVWALLAVVSSAFLLRSLKGSQNSNGGFSWVGYGVTATLGMYSHLFFTWVLVSHGLYVLLTEKLRLSQKLLRYLVVSVGISAAFFPWVWVVATRMETIAKTTKWASTYSDTLASRSVTWLHNLGIGFIDFGWRVRVDNPVSYLILALVAYSTYQLCRHTPRRVWLFVLLLMGVSSMAQVLPDVLHGGRRSLLPRYSLTAYLGIELAVGYAIAQVFDAQYLAHLNTLDPATIASRWQSFSRPLKRVLSIALILGGMLSSGLITQSLGWGKGSSAFTTQASPIINQVSQPLVLSDVDHTYALSLVHQVSPDTRFILLNREQSPDYAAVIAQLPANSDFFLFAASPSMVAYFQAADSLRVMPQTKDMRTARLYQAKRLRAPLLVEQRVVEQRVAEQRMVEQRVADQ